MISVQMNDAAADSLGAAAAGGATDAVDGLVPELRALAEAGVVRRDEVVVFTDDVGSASPPSEKTFDLTQWECDRSRFHLDDMVPVDTRLRDECGVPVISESDQRRLLAQGLMLALRIARSGQSLEEPVALRCIIGTNSTGGTFRFHRIRPGEQWHSSDLNSYPQDEKVIVVEAVADRR